MNKRLRGITVVAVLLLAASFLMPTVKWFYFSTEEDKAVANSSLEKLGEEARKKADADVNELLNLAKNDANASLPTNLVYFSKMAKIDYKKAKKDIPSNWTALNVLSCSLDKDSVLEFAVKHYAETAKAIKARKDGSLKLGLDLAGGLSATLQADFSPLESKLGQKSTDQEKIDAMNSTLTLIRGRADQFGTTEPIIRQQGNDQILIELPGEKDPDAVNRLIRGKGSLVFHLVDDELTTQFNQYAEQNPNVEIDDNGRIDDRDILPVGFIVAPYYVKDDFGVDVFRSYVVMQEEVGLEGSHLTKADTSFDEFNKPVVNFTLDSEGATIFGALTKRAADERRALSTVMDGKVRSVAGVSEPITGGAVMVSGFTMKEATDLSTLLKTSSLPVNLDIVLMQKVGPTLGQETIEAGLKALILGVGLVFAFVIVYYTGAGALACFILLANLILTLGVLSSMGFTLTLTSLAGLVLNIGMAVDANVLIFERIKEELRQGKNRDNAVDAGFARAGLAIIDANVTTLIAAALLSMMASGSVKGFAVTLTVGIVTTLFTALFLGRLLFDVGTETFNKKSVWIGFGRKA